MQIVWGDCMGSRVVKLEFDNFDRFRETLVGWDDEITQLSPGRLCLSYNQIIFENLTLTRLRLNRHVSDRLTVDPGLFRFVVCFNTQVFSGIPVPAGSMVIFGRGREYRNVLCEGHDALELTVTSALLHSLGVTLVDACPRQLSPERCVIPLADHQIRAFRALAENPFFVSKLDPVTGHRWAAAIRDHSISLLTEVVRAAQFSKEEKRQKPIQGWPLTSRALSFIDQHRYEHIAVGDISEALGCTCRALQFAFQDALKTTPNQYLLARRLHLARSALLGGLCGSVTRVATDHHFFHFGRFSQYYQTLFAERPSETLQRAKRRAQPSGEEPASHQQAVLH